MRLVVTATIFIATSEFAHSGELRKDGYHNDRTKGGNHCHWGADLVDLLNAQSVE